jgi:hypothetical protein
MWCNSLKSLFNLKFYHTLFCGFLMILTINNKYFPQYSEISVMHFLFSLFRIKNLYMFRALLSQPQETLHKLHLIYCVRVMSVGCTRIGVPLQSWCCQLTKHARNIPSAVCVAPTEDEQVILETCRGS